MRKFTILSRRLEYDRGWIKIYQSRVKLQTGQVLDWYTPYLQDFVVVPMVEDEVYLARERRIAWKKYLITPPTGGVGKAKTEKARLAQAHNELREEIGFDSRIMRKLGVVLLSSRTHSKAHIYLAKNLFRSKKPREIGESIEVVRMPFSKAFKMFLSGALPTTSYSIAAFSMALNASQL